MLLCLLLLLLLLLLHIQGSNRLQRGLLYMDYLRAYSNYQHSPQMAVVPNMGHDQVPMLNSQEFQKFVS